ncbi:MAG: heavy-metal-associated domain-containing protein [Lachnospiraceae bacterium]|nr:heavy-metal-associated domain-containing protein [Lachnospiraceae bacterium]
MMNTLKVEGMMCEGCVNRVIAALKEINVVAEVSLENKSVSFEGDSELVKTVVSEIEDLGFEVVE